MSKALCLAVKESLKAAHAAYLVHQRAAFCKHMNVAEQAVAAIKALGAEGDCARTMELMALEAELILIKMFPRINQLSEIILQYELAALQMLLPPSKIVGKDAPMLPDCRSALEFFGGVSDRTAKELEQATSLYAHMTDGGGGGIAEIYRAEMAMQRGSPQEAIQWAEEALKKMTGDRWIEPIARRLIAGGNELLNAVRMTET